MAFMCGMGGGGAYSTATTSSGVMWYGNNTCTTSSTDYTGINCWMTSDGSVWGSGGGTCTTEEYVNYQQMQALRMQHQQSLMQMQMQALQAQQLYAAQGLHQEMCVTNFLTEDQRRAHRAQAEALQQDPLEQLKKSEEVQNKAREKAKELLLEHLTPAQKGTFNKNNWFVVEGGRSKQQYRIQASTHSINIEVLDGKKVTHKLCAHLHHSAGAPLHDHILAQKIMLECAEDDFLKIANRHAA